MLQQSAKVFLNILWTIDKPSLPVKGPLKSYVYSSDGHFLLVLLSVQVHWVCDPCTLNIDGVIIGLSSTDILFQLGAEEISGYVDS